MIKFQRKIAGELVLVESHTMMDLDEITAFYLAKTYGTKKFVKKYYQKGRLALGINDSPFDEHIKADGNTSTSLVIEGLEATGSKLPDLGKLVRYIHINDVEAKGTATGLYNLVKFLHRYNPKSPMRWIEWALKAINVKVRYDLDNGDYTVERIHCVMQNNLRSQVATRKWWTDAQSAMQFKEDDFNKSKEEMISKGRIITIKTVAGPLKLAVVESDLSQINRVARFFDAAICIQFKNNGQVQIYKDNSVSLDLSDVVRSLRLREQFHSVSRILWESNFKKLEAPGLVEAVPEWYYFRRHKGQGIFNGSLTHPDTQTTKIPHKEIIWLVVRSLDPDFFEIPQMCSKGYCQGKDCGFYLYGWKRCRHIRWETISLARKEVKIA